MAEISKKQKPEWIKMRSSSFEDDRFRETMEIVKKYEIDTVCEEALCPNIGECWKNKIATFVIMGEICTRNCAFCNLKCGVPKELQDSEPERIALAIMELGLKYAVITSVTRDDLPDGGAAHFACTINKIRELSPGTKIEILTPDFKGSIDAIKIISETKPDVFAHNIEIVKRLHNLVKKPPSEYDVSLKFLSDIKQICPDNVTKSGIIVGVGEEKRDVVEAMEDLFQANVDILTIGQYLSPSPLHFPVARYVTLEEFRDYQDIAYDIGFKKVVSGPLVRSSFRAKEAYSIICSLKR